MIRHKARMVAKGFLQTPGIDYTEVLSPVLKYSTIHLLLVLQGHFGCNHSLIDVTNIFVNVPLKEELYIQQLEGLGVEPYKN